MFKFIVSIVVVAFSAQSFAQVNPPCGLDYGSSSDESTITQQMRYGTINDAVAAVEAGKNSRGTSLGCPQVAYNYTPANTLEPSLSDIVTIWSNVHAPAISSYTVNCPRIGRYESNSALGAYYAALAGYYSDYSKLEEIAEMMFSQQYASWNISSPDSRNEGVYAYINVPSSDPCYPGGVVGSSVDAVCSALPTYCQTYTSGQYIGQTFLTSGQDDANNWFDGGLAYDHGWVGVQMIETAIQQNNPLTKANSRNSVELAAKYCISEYPVKNHNYTAKLIWLLAQMYAWTGDTAYLDELNYKLDKNLLPGILWDENNDGIVDGTSPSINFSDLTSVAQEPGRMWDGHNSLPWYHAMNAWALTEAYVAFRDQGDLVRANELKPYVIGMVDNLANEVINQGVVTPDQLGVRDISYCLLTAIWKLSQYENEPHPNWESAAWAMWNSGYFNSYSTHSVCVGLYLLITSDTPFVPLHLREDFELSTVEIDSEMNFQLVPNPSDHSVFIQGFDGTEFEYSVVSMTGEVIQNGESANGQINIEEVPAGSYILEIDRRISRKLLKM